MRSLKQKAIWGTIWTLLGYGSSQGLRLVSNLVLTRLLFPELFGLMALVQTFITGLHLFSDIGIRPSIIQNARGDDPAFLNTAWTVQVLRGIGLWICCLIIAWPIATFYEKPQLLWLIPVLGITTVFDGFTSTALATLNRHLEIAKLTRFEFVIQLISTVIMLVWAYYSRSIWALVGNSLIASGIKMLWSHRLGQPYTNRFAWESSALKDLRSFGQWIFVSTAMTFLASQTDRLILGRLFTLDLLGIYTIAFTLSDLPQAVLQSVSANIIFPVLAQQAHLPRAELRRKLLQKRRLLVAGMAIGLAVLACFGDLLIQVLYDARYLPAAWMLPILALGNWPRMLPLTTAPVLIAVGRPLYGAVGNFLKFIYMLVLLPLGFATIGPVGAILVIAFNDIPFYIAISYGLWREGLSTLGQDLQGTALLLAVVGAVLLVRFKLGFGFPLSLMPLF
jgi:O-antigen/teichoic acid export membrane protein